MVKTAKTHYQVKNKITGYVYDLPKEDCDRLVTEEPYNFEVIDKDYIMPDTEVKKTTVYSQVVEDENNSEDIVKPIAEYTYNELKAYLKKYGLDTSGKKDDLMQKALDYNTQLTDLLAAAQAKGIEIEQNPITVDELKELLEKAE